MSCVANCGPNLHELADGSIDLRIQNRSVGDDDNRVKDGLAAFGKSDQLMGQPRNGVRFATSR